METLYQKVLQGRKATTKGLHSETEAVIHKGSPVGEFLYAIIQGMEDYHMPQIKQPTFDLSRFKVDQSESERYGEAVKQTAKLLKRPYMQLHNIFTREKWSVEEIERAYQNATKHNGNIPSDVCWWYNRKKRNETNT